MGVFGTELGHLPRFERCFIGLFTASSRIVAGEGEVVEGPVGMTVPWDGHHPSTADHSNAAAESCAHASASISLMVGGCLEGLCDRIC